MIKESNTKMTTPLERCLCKASFLVLSLPAPPSLSPQPSRAIAPDTAGGDGGDTKDFLESSPSLDALPDVVLTHIFRMLPDRDRGRLARTCRKINGIMHSALVWTNVSIQLKCDGKMPEMSATEISQIRLSQSRMKYWPYFKNVEVVMRSLSLSASAIIRLKQFAEKGILKRVKLMVDNQNGMDSILSEPSVHPFPWEYNCECRRCGGIPDHKREVRFKRFGLRGDLDGRCYCRNPVQPDPNEGTQMRELITTNTHITLQLRGGETFFETENLLKRFYSITDKGQFCQSVNTLILPESLYEFVLTDLCPQQSPTPTAVLLTDFINLTELQLSFHNISENALHELSNASHPPLKKLVLLHKDYKIDMGRRFPSVLSTTWRQLLNTCPELTVQCCVRILSKRFPPLTDTIKPETPLVRLEVIAEKEEIRESDIVKKMKELCKEHKCSFLIVP